MMSRKKPGVAFWATVVVVAALVGYPLSFGPACWICVRAHAGGDVVHAIYRPIINLGSLPQAQRENPGPLPRAVLWYANLGAPRGIVLFMGDGEIWANRSYSTADFWHSVNWKL